MDDLQKQAQGFNLLTPKRYSSSPVCTFFETQISSPRQKDTIRRCSGDESRKSPINLQRAFSDKFSSSCRDSYKIHPLLGENSDWMLAERAQPWTPPASPEQTLFQGNSVAFRFSPYSQFDGENSCSFNAGNVHRETVRKRLFAADSLSGMLEDRGSIESASLSREQLAPCTCLPRQDNRVTSELKQNKRVADIETQSNKRQLEKEEDCFETPKKRQRRDWMREFGLRYLKQLKADVVALRMKLKKPSLEVLKPVDCTCAVMERHFLQMSESAYRSLRRMDCSPRGFQQFKTELLQTNAVIQDSLQVLQNIKSFCDHKY